MQKYKTWLIWGIWAVLGVFLGSSIYRIYRHMKDAAANPYWYKSILISGLIAAVCILALGIIIYLIDKRSAKS